MPRPHVVLSVAVSLDGYIDDTGPDRLLLSNGDDFERVDQVRADSDAILIGAGTMRADNPRLIVKSEERRAQRVKDGRPEYPLKVTISGSGNLDPALKFWHHGGDKLVYTTTRGEKALGSTLEGLATVVSLGDDVDLAGMLEDLGNRGIGRLMVEGGGQVHTAFLSQNLADEMHVAVAPIIVGDNAAPRFLLPGHYPGGPLHRMHLANATKIGDVVLLQYMPKTDTADAA